MKQNQFPLTVDDASMLIGNVSSECVISPVARWLLKVRSDEVACFS